MFFDNLSQIPAIAQKTSCVIFVVPPETKIDLKHPLYLRPDESKKTTLISVEQIRDFISLTQNRETSNRFFIIAPADAMNEAAQNAFLKTFEEPKTFCHFVLLTEQPSLLLPTILSRAQVFFPHRTNLLDAAPDVNAKTLATAKKMIAATSNQLPALAAELTKSKTNTREQILQATSTAIELLYKSYFKTQNPKFLAKLPNFLQLYDRLNHNGHLKLHLVADLC